MDRKSLLQAKSEVLAARELPKGYRIDCDGRTDNLLVRGNKLGFAISRRSIDDGCHVTNYPAALDALIEAEAKESPKLILPPIERKLDGD